MSGQVARVVIVLSTVLGIEVVDVLGQHVAISNARQRSTSLAATAAEHLIRILISKQTTLFEIVKEHGTLKKIGDCRLMTNMTCKCIWGNGQKEILRYGPRQFWLMKSNDGIAMWYVNYIGSNLKREKFLPAICYEYAIKLFSSHALLVYAYSLIFMQYCSFDRQICGQLSVYGEWDDTHLDPSYKLIFFSWSVTE